MTPERWRRIREVLESALEVPEGEVAAWLDRHCAADLRSEVEELVEASREERTLLDEPAVRADNALASGTRIGPYLVESLVGMGGAGAVYRARDLRLGRAVAIKLLSFGGSLDDVLAEARSASALGHPNIVVVHDVLEFLDVPAIVMEYVEGRTLAETLEAGPLSAARMVELARQVAAALGAAHQAGILHRDLKPSNVMVGSDGVAKVLDFGIARPMPRAAQGLIRPAGTRGYMPPEQERGEALDERADIYAFGVLVREMLRGADRCAGGEPPTALQALVDRCTATDPESRFRNIGELEKALASLAHPPPRPQWWQPAAGLALVVLIALSTVYRGGPTSAPPRYTANPLAASEPARRHPALSPDGRRVIFSSSVDDRPQLFLQGVDELRPMPLGVEGRHAAFSPAGNRLAFRSERDGGGLFLMELTGERTVRRLTRSGFFPAWSPDGREIAFSTEEFERAEARPTTGSQLRVVAVETGAVRSLTEAADIRDAIQPAWSPDGSRVAFWSVGPDAGRSVWTLPATGGAAVRVTDHSGLNWSPAWSPDGWLHWASDRAGAMTAWRVRLDSAGRSAAAPQPIPLPSSYVSFFSFARDGTMVFAAAAPEASIWRVDLDSRVPPLRITPSTLWVAGPSLSPDGEWIVAYEESVQDRLFVVRTDGSDFRYLTSGPHRDRGPAWSPDGNTIAFLSNRGGDYRLWQVRPDGSDVRELLSYEEGAWSPVWSPSGHSVAWFAKGFRPMLLELDDGEIGDLPMPLEHGFRPEDWSPEGGAIAGIVRGIDGTRLGAAILEIATGAYRPLEGPCRSVRWMPDGKHLLCAADRELVVIDAVRGASVGGIPLARPVMPGFAISPDGRHAYVTLLDDPAEIWIARPQE